MQVTLGQNGKPIVPITKRMQDNLDRTYGFIDTCGGLTAHADAAKETRAALEKFVRQVTGAPEEGAT